MRLIDAYAIKVEIQNICDDCWHPYRLGDCPEHCGINDAVKTIDSAPTVDAVPVVRCKDCKHRPTGINRDDLEFPDDKCPCKCEDYWYSWKPSDDWYCGNGERKDDDHHE